jgi:hypothetical protein
MMTPLIIVVVVVIVTMAAIGAPFRLERSLHVYEIRSQGKEHVLDHMVGTNAKNVTCNFGGQMAISQVPGKTRKLTRVFVPDFDNKLGSGPNLQQSPILELQAISIGHGNGSWKIENEFLALISDQANATSVTRVKIESDRTCCLFLRPMPGGTTY